MGLGKRLTRWEKVLYGVILIVTLFSRFYILGDRAISHDESIHTKFSWNLYAGHGFQHSPMMHGPLLFHLTALSYFLFGPNDFTSRIVVALLGTVLVMMPLLFRRWMGRKGALIASLMLMLSPSITYYSRYIRHDIPAMVTAVLLIWGIFQYLKDGQARWIYLIAAAYSLMYTTKEVSYIYTAIFGVLLFIPFAVHVLTKPWVKPKLFRFFVGMLLAATVMALILGLALRNAEMTERALDEAGNTRVADVALPIWGRLAGGLALVALIASVVLAFYGLGEAQIRQLYLFDLLMVIGTLTLPLGSALLINLAGFDPLDYSTQGILRSSLILVPMLGLSVILGVWWDHRRWPIIAAIHYAIFLIFFTTVFTNGTGIASGLVGGLGYWLAQQGVERGSQPWYYYGLLMPLYEYLPLLFSVGGGIGALVMLFKVSLLPPAKDLASGSNAQQQGPEGKIEPSPLPSQETPERRSGESEGLFPLFLLGWTVLTWVAYTYAGEKMPWLVVHIALPSIFLAAWGLGRVIDNIDADTLIRRWGWLVVVSLPLVVVAAVVFGRAAGGVIDVLRTDISAAGPSLTQLETVGRLIGGAIALLAFGGALIWSVTKVGVGKVIPLTVATLATFLAILTTRTMTMANYINYDLAKEFLVYAHGTPDIKKSLDQIRDISWRTTGSAHGIQVAYGEDGSWPMTWYMVDFPNEYFYGTEPDPERLQECPAVIAGQPQWGKVDPILNRDYMAFEYNYLWWPIQDYYDLTWPRIRNAITNPDLRAGVWDIIWDRDYTHYAEAMTAMGFTRTITLKEWPYRKEYRLYIRRDVAQDAWNYRLGPEGVEQVVRPEATPPPDPYAAGVRTLPVEHSIMLPGANPRDIALAPDQTMYVVDTLGHRIWHVEPSSGEVLHSWGEYGVGEGQFSEPWGVAVDNAGNVYVADTWNHRIQKFDAEGTYLLHWGTFAQIGMGDASGWGAFFGPRDIAIGPGGEDQAMGNVYVTDTGNKRVQVFDAEGAFLRQFGGGGREAGQLDEPVGIAMDEVGQIFIADTWNHRIQILTNEGLPLRQWDITSWQVNNPEEKPFITVHEGMVYVSMPTQGRVLAFTSDGTYVWAVEQGSDGITPLTFPEGVLVGPDNVLYVADAHTGKIIGFQIP